MDSSAPSVSRPALTGQACEGTPEMAGSQPGLLLSDGGFAIWNRAHLNSDGSARAYHPRNQAGGALVHLCNAGEVFLPDGTHYYGSKSNAICTGPFMDDYQRIAAAGWNNPEIGVIRWFGVLGSGEPVTIAGNKVAGTVPVMQSDGSGFYVSPTALYDRQYPVTDQRRYVEPLTVPAAVIPDSAMLRAAGVKQGTLGVAVRRGYDIIVPFIVGDQGPRIGEVTPALARRLAGLPIDPQLPVSQRKVAGTDAHDILYVFFGDDVMLAPFTAESVEAAAGSAFRHWGGEERLSACMQTGMVPGR